MNLKAQAKALRETKRRELEALYPALKSPAPAPAPRLPVPPRTLPEPYRLVLGRDEHGPFCFDTRLLCAHVDMVGGTGGGKSNAMRQLAWLNIGSDPALKRATIIIDPHGNHRDSLHRATLRRIIDTEVYKKRPVYVIDANSAWCTGLRLFGGGAAPSVDADNGIEAFRRVRGDEELGPTLHRALHGLLAAITELGWTLAEADLLLDPFDAHGIRAWAIEHLKDRYAKRALERLHMLARDPRLRSEFQIEVIGSENRLMVLLAAPAMRAIVGTPTLEMRRDVLDAGAVLLIDTSGGDEASEIAGDLLGKLVIRALLHAAKRRQRDSLALVFADECARYVSQDWERALAELRKYRVGFVSGHQTYAMLGKPDDPARLAIEQIPATKIVFRMNSIEEASELAPEVMHLNLEQPVEALIKPTVVGHRTVRLRNQGVNVSAATSTSTTSTQSQTTTIERGEQHSKTRSRSETLSESETDATNWSHTHSESESVGESDAVSESDSVGASLGASRGSIADYSSSAGSSLSYDRAGLTGVAGQPTGGTISSGTGTGSGRSRTESWSAEEEHSSGSSHSETRISTASDSDTIGGSRSHTAGRAETTGEADTVGHSQGTATSAGTATGVTRGTTRGQGSTVGWSEALEPVLADLPSAVHSLENAKHQAAEYLCALPTGTCVVRSVRSGSIEGAIVQVPERRCAAIDDKQYAADLCLVVEHGRAGKPMAEARTAIEQREQAIIASAARVIGAQEPESFRVSREIRGGTRGRQKHTERDPQ
jgi:Helicase HerA, central domain